MREMWKAPDVHEDGHNSIRWRLRSWVPPVFGGISILSFRTYSVHWLSYCLFPALFRRGYLYCLPRHDEFTCDKSKSSLALLCPSLHACFWCWFFSVYKLFTNFCSWISTTTVTFRGSTLQWKGCAPLAPGLPCAPRSGDVPGNVTTEFVACPATDGCLWWSSLCPPWTTSASECQC